MKNYAKINKKVSKMFAAPKSQQSKNDTTISNLKTRLKAGGVNVDKELDDRNAIEKALNLEKNQGLIRDLFELRGRPQQAIFSGWKTAQEGGTFSEGFKNGLTGEEEDIMFKEILKNYGMNDREGKLDLVDVLGFAGDVVLDPMDIIPVAGFSNFSKAVEAGDSIKDASKLLDTTSDLIGKGVKAGVKKGAKLTDNFVESGLKAIDSSRGINYENVASEFADQLGKVGEGNGLLETYKGIKNDIASKFSTNLSKNARLSQSVNNAKEASLKTSLQGIRDRVIKEVDNVVEKTGKAQEEVLSDFQKMLDGTKALTVGQVISDGVNGHIKYSKSIVNKLEGLLDDIPDDTVKDALLTSISKDKNGMLILGEPWDKLVNNYIVDKAGNTRKIGNGIADIFDEAKLSEVVNRQNILGTSYEKEIKALKKYYKENFPELYKYIDGEDMIYNQMNREVEKVFPHMSGISEKFRNEFGYSKHVLDKDYNINLQKLVTDYGANLEDVEKLMIKSGSGGTIFSTPSKTLNARKYNMSAAEANVLRKREILKELPNLSPEGKKFVEENIQLFDDMAVSGINEYISNMPVLAKKTAQLDDILIQQGFGVSGNLTQINTLEKQLSAAKSAGNTTEIKAIQDKINSIWKETPLRVVTDRKNIPRGFTLLDDKNKEWMVNYLESISKKTGSNDIKEISRVLKNIDNLAIDPTVMNILKINNSTSRKNDFLKLYDGMLDYFKGNKTASLTNQMNNLSGNITNMYLSGIPVGDISKYTARAYDDLRDWENLFLKGTQDINSLTPKEAEIFENISDFMKYVGVLSDEELARVRDLDSVITKVHSANKSKLPLEQVRVAFAKLNAAEDRVFKFSTYLYAKDHPGYAKRLLGTIEDVDIFGRVSSKNAGEVVKKVLFDPYDLTSFEQSTMKRLIPFYTFTKKNLAFHLDNMGTNTRKYTRLFKAYNSAMESTLGDDYDNIADYLKDNMYIPIPTKTKDGKYRFLKATLPVGDLTDMFSDPLSGLVSKVTPAIRLPLELATNKNSFLGSDIEKYPGQKSTQLPFMSKKGEYLLSSLTGLDVPLKQGYNIYDNIKNSLPGERLQNTISGLTTIEKDPNQEKLSRQYEEIDKLENIMSRYKDKGYTFATMNELKRANKNDAVSNIKNRLDGILNKYK